MPDSAHGIPREAEAWLTVSGLQTSGEEWINPYNSPEWITRRAARSRTRELWCFIQNTIEKVIVNLGLRQSILVHFQVTL